MFDDAEIIIEQAAVLDNPCSDERTDDHWDHDTENHPYPLKMSDLVERCVISDFHVQNRCQDEIATHHYRSGNAYEKRFSCQKQQNEPYRHDHNAWYKEFILVARFDEPADNDANDRCQNQNDTQKDRITVDAEIALDINDKVRRINLDRNTENRQTDEIDIEIPMGADRFGFKSVCQSVPVICL